VVAAVELSSLCEEEKDRRGVVGRMGKALVFCSFVRPKSTPFLIFS
jgi:hypothetical protein